MHTRRQASSIVLLAIGLTFLLAGCDATMMPKLGDTEGSRSVVLGKSKHYAVALVGKGESLDALAKRFLGDAKKAWVIADANGSAVLRSGQTLIIPLSQENSVGVHSDGYQTVPVLSYHRLVDDGGKLSVSPRQFEEQMAFLKQEGYHVIRVDQLVGFLRGKEAVPRRSVVLTIDDGHPSAYDVAFPVLRKYGFPATLFVYTDFVQAGGLTWAQMREMHDSGLISIQPHSKTHDDLTIRMAHESPDQYRARISEEVNGPAKLLEARLGSRKLSYAYPFGDTNEVVVDEVKRAGYETGVTVRRGGSPFFAYPYTLRRTLIYGHYDIAKFEQALKVFKARDLK